MSTTLSQTQTVISSLLAAGFSRKEFSARAARHYVGRHPETKKQMFEYGAAEISFNCPMSRVGELVDGMVAEGFRVEKTISGGNAHFTVQWNDGKPGQFIVSDLDEREKELAEMREAQDEPAVDLWTSDEAMAEVEAAEAEMPAEDKQYAYLRRFARDVMGTASKGSRAALQSVKPAAEGKPAAPAAGTFMLRTETQTGEIVEKASKKCYSHAIIGVTAEGEHIVIKWVGSAKLAARSIKYWSNPENKSFEIAYASVYSAAADCITNA